MHNIGLSGPHGLENHGLCNLKTIYWNLVPADLVEQAVLRGEGQLSATGAFVVNTGTHTGRSPGDKFVVYTGGPDEEAIWWGKVNQPLEPDKFQTLHRKIKAYVQGRDVFVQDVQVGAHPSHRTYVRVISEKAWASLFSYNLFRRLTSREIGHFTPDYTILHCPDFQSDPEEDGTKSNTVIAFDFEKRLVLIGGTSYAGEVKKSVFSIMNYLLPRRDILSMHCSANVGEHGDVALFFGLSGTGKTTLSSDPERGLIGDDEHGWTNEGVFNFEGGCYAKTIRLSHKLEPLIWDAAQRFGTVLENVVYNSKTRRVDFESDRLTENTRAAYPLDYIPNHVAEGYAGHPKNIFFLSADAFGVLPPMARLTSDQAMYYFLSGYTSKLAGTEKGLGSEPLATFSACFGAPFLPLHPHVYADLLGEKITQHKVNVWLINTGWTGGPYGVGNRIMLPYTRSMIRAVLSGGMADAQFIQDESFGLWIPTACPGVPGDLLKPINTWTDAENYRRQANSLIERFALNFRQFEDAVSSEVRAAAPHPMV